jgi:hypothetical protein
VRGRQLTKRWFAVRNEGGAVKTIWACLFALSSIAAYFQISVALSDAGDPLGAIAPDGSSGRPAPASARNDAPLAARLSEYMFLHNTRKESHQFTGAARANVCPE